MKIDYEYRLAVAYQIVGELFARLDIFETEYCQNILSYLNGEDVPDPLPFSIDNLETHNEEEK